MISADQAMYASKRGGKNRVMGAPTNGEPARLSEPARVPEPDGEPARVSGPDGGAV